MLKRLSQLFLIFVLTLLLCPAVLAAEEEAQQVELTASATGFDYSSFLTDGKDKAYFAAWNGSTIHLTSETSFSSLYIMFYVEYGEYTITDNTSGDSITAGQNRFLHEFIRLPNATTSVTITFPRGYVAISEIRAFTAGTPAGVQIWEPPLEGGCDLLLMSTHGDDEHLFFAGILPMYACEQNYDVQVCYFTDHREWTKDRCHEMLNGLWAVGVRNYPHFGSFPDFRLDDREATYLQYETMGVTKTMMLDFCVEQIRRFRPQVVVGHDFKGEYGHGMHQVYADQVSQAIYLTNDPNYFPSSAERYGLWDVPKTYFHVYPENSVELELDTPLQSFAGMTAFDVSRYVGFPQHVSQQIYTTFTHWVYGPNLEVTNSKDITRYSPRYYGLYRTTVGPDVEKNDLMENTKTYNERKRAEEDRLAAEEAARLEAERLEQERLAAEEAERIAAEEAAKQAEINKRLEEKRLKEEAQQRKKEQQQLTLILITLGVLLLLSVSATLITRITKGKKQSTDKEVEELPAEEAANTPTETDTITTDKATETDET